MARFFETGASANLLKSPRRSIGSLAYATRRYFSFARSMEFDHFPFAGDMYPDGAQFSTTELLTENTLIPPWKIVM